MIKFFKRLLQAFRETILSFTYDLFADTEDGWTEEDSKSLQGFLNTETGQKLNARLRNFVFESAIKATRNVSNTKFHSGVAHGVFLTVNAIQQHIFASSPRKVSTSEGEQQSSVAGDLALN